MRRHVEGLDPVGILRGIQHPIDRGVVVEIHPPENVAHGVGDDLGRPDAPVDEPGPAPVERLVEGLERGGVADPRRRQPVLEHLVGLEGRIADSREEIRVDALDLGQHARDDVGRLPGDVAHPHHAAQAVQHDPGDRVDHGGVARDRNDVARRLDGLLLGLPVDVLSEGLVLAGREAPQLREDPARHRHQPLGELAIGCARRALRTPRRSPGPRPRATAARGPRSRRGARNAGSAARCCRTGNPCRKDHTSCREIPDRLNSNVACW